MHCKRCGKAIGTDRGICPFCGESFDAGQATRYNTFGTQAVGPVRCPHCGKSISIKVE